MKHRIYLEKMLPEDFESFYTMVSNEKVMLTVTGRALSEVEALKKFKSLMSNSILHKSFGSFKVMDASNTKLLGFAKLEITRENLNLAELGFLLLPEYWGKGYGSEIADILLDVAKSDPHLKRVWANVDPDNKASRKILINNGFESEELGIINGLPSEILGVDVFASPT